MVEEQLFTRKYEDMYSGRVTVESKSLVRFVLQRFEIDGKVLNKAMD